MGIEPEPYDSKSSMLPLPIVCVKLQTKMYSAYVQEPKMCYFWKFIIYIGVYRLGGCHFTESHICLKKNGNKKPKWTVPK